MKLDDKFLKNLGYVLKNLNSLNQFNLYFE